MNEYLKSVCETHGLVSLTISCFPAHINPFIAYVHPTIDTCFSGAGLTAQEAVGEALAERARGEAAATEVEAA